jgi:hypothetical protein
LTVYFLALPALPSLFRVFWSSSVVILLWFWVDYSAEYGEIEFSSPGNLPFFCLR